MNLTPRDKRLLILLVSVIFLVVYIKFLLLPKVDNINELKTQISDFNTTYAVNMNYKNMVNSIDSEIKIITQRLSDLRNKYPPNIDCDELLVLIKDVSDESGIKLSSLSFSPIQVVKVNTVTGASIQGQLQTTMSAIDSSNQLTESQEQQNQQPQNEMERKIANYYSVLGLVPTKNSTGSSIVPNGTGYFVPVKLNATGSNSEIKKFFDLLNNLGNKAYLKDVDIQYGSGELNEYVDKQLEEIDLKLKLTATIEFYGIMDSGAGEYYLLPNGKWFPSPASGTTNIFQPSLEFMDKIISGNFDESQKTNESNMPSTNAELEYDFSIVASQFGDGFAPSVSVSSKNVVNKQKYQNPIAYGDSKNVENVELFIEQKNGKFYCKFKTDHESYPDDQYKELMEFTPNGRELVLVIIASDRISKEDTAGVNISIVNNTKLKLIYKVINDNNENPRVKIGKTVGDVVNEKY